MTVPDLATLFATANTITLGQAVDAFVHIECAGGSPLTERAYRKNLAVLQTGLGGKSLAELQAFDVASWGAGQLRSGKSPYTIKARIQAARRLFRWLHKLEVTTVDLGQLLKGPRLPRSARSGIADGDLQTILDAARSNLRDTALLNFLASTGCRRGGAANLTVSDLDLTNPDERFQRRATVREKGDKERVVIFSEETLAALLAWLPLRPERYGDSVFGLAPVGVSGVLRRYRARLGIHRPAGPHQLRHRFARKSIMDGMDIALVSKLLGHENFAMTERFYAQFTMDQIQETYDRINKKAR